MFKNRYALKPALFILFIAVSSILQTAEMSASSFGKDKGSEKFWVEVAIDKGGRLVAGDSALVTFVVHSALPIAKIESKPIRSIKNATFRSIRFDRDATASQYIYRGHVINTLIWAQIVVKPEKTGEITIPECTYEAQLYTSRYKGWFGNDIYGDKVKVEAKSPKKVLTVIEKPSRTTAEMQGSGTIL